MDRTRARDPVRNLKHNTRHATRQWFLGRLRRILALPRRQTYRGSWAGRTSRGWNSIQASSPSSSARQRQIELAARDGPVPRAPLHASCEYLARVSLVYERTIVTATLNDRLEDLTAHVIL
jgi:hypothetical protein